MKWGGMGTKGPGNSMQLPVTLPASTETRIPLIMGWQPDACWSDVTQEPTPELSSLNANGQRNDCFVTCGNSVVHIYHVLISVARGLQIYASEIADV